MRRILIAYDSAYGATCAAAGLVAEVLTGAASEPTFPVSIDPAFSVARAGSRRSGFMERNHTADYYLGHFTKLIPGIAPLGIGLFKGNLELARLSPVHRLIIRFAIYSLPEIQEGEYLDPEVVRDWAEALSTRLEECWRERAREAGGNA